jgi:hypothetical protein
MNSTDVSKSMASVQGSEGRKPYVALELKRLSPEAAKELLLRRADTKDPEVQHMLDRVAELQGKMGP